MRRRQNPASLNLVCGNLRKDLVQICVSFVFEGILSSYAAFSILLVERGLPRLGRVLGMALSELTQLKPRWSKPNWLRRRWWRVCTCWRAYSSSPSSSSSTFFFFPFFSLFVLLITGEESKGKFCRDFTSIDVYNVLGVQSMSFALPNSMRNI